MCESFVDDCCLIMSVAWSTIGTIREACRKLPVPTHRPIDFVAALMLPLFRWSVARVKPDVFEGDDEGQASSDQMFDSHMDHQRENFLQAGKHHEAKRHGKLRTKFDRMLAAFLADGASQSLIGVLGQIVNNKHQQITTNKQQHMFLQF